MIKFLLIIGVIILTINSAQIKVLQSEDEETYYTIQGKQAEFGYLDDYSQSSNFMGEISLPVNSIEIEELQYGCKPFSVNTPIVLLKRGECKFAIKANQAQLAGAKLMIIANNIEEDISALSLVDRSSNNHFNLGIIMINFQDGIKLQKLVEQSYSKNKQHISLSVYLDKIAESENIQLDFWFDSLTPYTYDFFYAYSQIYSEMIYLGDEPDKRITFNMHSYVKKDPYSSTGYDKTNCIDEGQFCAVDPDQQGPLTGKDTIEYDIKFHCLKQNIELRQFLDIVIEFRYQCLGSSYTITSYNDNKYNIDQCFQNLESKYLGQEQQVDVKQCYSLNNSQYKQIMQKQVQDIETYQVRNWPSLYVNKQLTHGDIGAKEKIYGLICQVFQKNENYPNICQRDQNVQIQTEEQTHILLTVTIICLAILFFGVILYIIMRKIRFESNSDLQQYVKDSVDNYMALGNGPNSSRIDIK